MADGDFKKKKKKPFYQSGAYVPPARPLYTSPGPKAPGMRLDLNMTGRGELQMRMCLSPPIASSVEDARAIAAADRPEIKSYPDEFVELVRAYVSGERPNAPYTDEQIARYVAGKGYDSMTRQDVARVRGLLGIDPSALREK